MNTPNDKDKTALKNDPREHCTAFCPECGSDLYYFDNECICKNKECNWTCGSCSGKNKL